MIDSTLFCSRCGRRAFISHSCYSCQYHLCVQCCAELTGSGATAAKAEVKQNVQTGANTGGSGGGGSGYECHQCKTKSIRLGKVGSREAICFRCKQKFTGVQFTYWCSTCDLDCCENCANEISKEMMEKMNAFMKNPMNAMNIGFGSKGGSGHQQQQSPGLGGIPF